MSTNGSTPRRLYLMQVAILPPPRNVPIVCYLVQTGDGVNILIDSGLPASMPAQHDRPSPIMGKNVLEQLADIGLQAEDIHLLVCTHYDLDHAGRLDAFPNAQLIVQRAHYDAARNGHPRFAPARAYWDQPAERYRFVEGDTELLPGLDLIATPGHTVGHQSVLVRLPETGPVLLTIDSVRTAGAFTPDHTAEGMDEDEEALRASTRKLLDLVEREHVALVVFGHDGEQWPTLKKAPDFYS